MVWGWLVLVVGIVYGYMKKGKQDKSDIFKAGLLWGLILAVVFAGIGYLTDTNAIGFGADIVGYVISFVIMTLIFILGVFIGDWLEHR